MSEIIIVALICIIPSVLVAIIAIISNNTITKIKIRELEKQINKQNQIIERTYFLEYDEIKERLNQLEKNKKD